jgi:hypothetical protein
MRKKNRTEQLGRDEDCSYAIREYGVTKQELDLFVRRMNQRIARERRKGTMTPFSGDIEKAIAS